MFTIKVRKENGNEVSYDYEGFREFYKKAKANCNEANDMPMLDDKVISITSESFDFSKMEIDTVYDLYLEFGLIPDVEDKTDIDNVIVSMIGYGNYKYWEDKKVIETLISIGIEPAELELHMILTGFEDMAYECFQNDDKKESD